MYDLGYHFEPWASLESKVKFIRQDLVLELAVKLSADVPGHVLEFGVFNGQSIMSIRDAVESHYSRGVLRRRPVKRIYGFDSFEGLREKFENVGVGYFATEVPKIPRVTLVKGYFEESLTPELAAEIGTVSFAHLDADLYSSTKFVLEWLTPLLQTGSLLLFDEFLGENKSEKRALDEWVDSSGVRVVPLADFSRNPSGHGPRVDKRVLFQVVRESPLQPLPKFTMPRQLQGPFLPKIKRRVRKILR